jgi:hypothetical protein
MDRRQLLKKLLGTTILGGVAALVCSGSSCNLSGAVSNVSSAAAGITTLTNDATGIINAVESKASAAILSVSTLWTEAKAAVTSIAGSATVQGAAGFVQTFVNDVNSVKTYLNSADGGQLISAIEAVIPEMVQVAGLAASLARRSPRLAASAPPMAISDAKKYLGIAS